jgi:hypothetical protein
MKRRRTHTQTHAHCRTYRLDLVATRTIHTMDTHVVDAMVPHAADTRRGTRTAHTRSQCDGVMRACVCAKKMKRKRTHTQTHARACVRVCKMIRVPCVVLHVCRTSLVKAFRQFTPGGPCGWSGGGVEYERRCQGAVTHAFSSSPSPPLFTDILW